MKNLRLEWDGGFLLLHVTFTKDHESFFHIHLLL